MAEHPIIFSGPMVRAILDGRKTQTRRVVKPQPWRNDVNQWLWEWHKGVHVAFHPNLDERYYPRAKLQHLSPYGQSGDLLWVREQMAEVSVPGVGSSWAAYSADMKPARDFRSCIEWKWKRPTLPSIHMPRWASRITLEIVSFRIQRVRDITNADAIDEGIRPDVLPACEDHPTLECWVSEPDDNHAYQTPRDAFCKTWDSINAKRGFGWGINPWVWVIEFRLAQADAAKENK